METLEHIPSPRKMRLERHFQKIECVTCTICEIEIEKQGNYCVLCSKSIKGCVTKVVYVEKRELNYK